MAKKSEGAGLRFRAVTMSVNCDKLDESTIIAMLHRWQRGIKGAAYIRHDLDKYSAKDEKESRKKVERKLAELDAMKQTLPEPAYLERKQEIESEILIAGNDKKPHWHILLDFGSSAKPVKDIADTLGIPENLICRVSNGKKGFANMLAYLTHITPTARNEGKYEYPFEDVKGLVFPDDVAYNDFASYTDFATAFESKTLHLDPNAVMVMEGKITPAELKKIAPEYYLNNMQKIARARLEYVNGLPTPDVLFNFYVGALNPEKEGRGGRIGKGLACQVLAVSHLKCMYPNADISPMTLDDLKPYVFFAGAEGVTFDGYDGQPIIIWEDVRGYDLVKLFGGIGRLFKALDTHPKPMAFNVKYGKVMLKNRINIFNGVETYRQFIDSLSQEYRESENGRGSFVTKEDRSQAQGRFPFFIEVSPEFVTANAQLEYLIGTTKYDFSHTFGNDLKLIAQHNQLFEHTEWLGRPFTEVEQIAQNGTNYAAPLPVEVFKKLDFTPEYEAYCAEHKRVAPVLNNHYYDNEQPPPMTYDVWFKAGRPNVYKRKGNGPMEWVREEKGDNENG